MRLFATLSLAALVAGCDDALRAAAYAGCMEGLEGIPEASIRALDEDGNMTDVQLTADQFCWDTIRAAEQAAEASI